MKKLILFSLFLFMFPILTLAADVNTKRGNFYATKIATIGDDETYTTNSNEVGVVNASTMAVQVRAACGSACTATIVVKFSALVNGSWDDDGNPFATITVNQTASTAVRKSVLLNVAGIDRIRITSIENTEDDDTNGDITNINCSFTYVSSRDMH